MAKQEQAAGILLYREGLQGIEVFLVHPGGPFKAKKDLGVWSIPKGVFEKGETPLDCALREFQEETGQAPPAPPYYPLASVTQKSGKVVHAWAARGQCDPALVRSNTFMLEFPRKSARWIEVPEVDRGEWFSPEIAKEKMNPAQAPLVDELIRLLNQAASAATAW